MSKSGYSENGLVKSLDVWPKQANIRRRRHESGKRAAVVPTGNRAPSALKSEQRLMMMAQDSTPNRPELSPASVEGLRFALTTFLSSTGDVTSLQPALRDIALEARAREIRAEQLLVLLKDIWFSLPQIARAPEGDDQNRLLQRVVTLCIREYYTG